MAAGPADTARRGRCSGSSGHSSRESSRRSGKVNEIFGGLGLDFVAAGLTLYLIIGPWARPGIASTSGTEPFPRDAWLPALDNSRFSPLAVILAIVAVIAVLVPAARHALRAQAQGRRPQQSTVPTCWASRRIATSSAAFAICGALAGLAGAIQATGFHHKLVPVGLRWLRLPGHPGGPAGRLPSAYVAPIAAFFAIVAVGSIALTLRLDVNSALGGVLTGVLVLFALMASGLRSWQRAQARLGRQQATAARRPGTSR